MGKFEFEKLDHYKKILEDENKELIEFSGSERISFINGNYIFKYGYKKENFIEGSIKGHLESKEIIKQNWNDFKKEIKKYINSFGYKTYTYN